MPLGQRHELPISCEAESLALIFGILDVHTAGVDERPDVESEVEIRAHYYMSGVRGPARIRNPS